MSLLVECSSSRWVDFLSIPDDAATTVPGEDNDLFVGRNISVTMTLINGTVTKFRDIVVLGELTIQSSNPGNTAVQPSVIARDVIVASKFQIDSVGLQSNNISILKDTTQFRNDLQRLFLEWVDFQRESVRAIGLRSILA
jgi:hypothetical protein